VDLEEDHESFNGVLESRGNALNGLSLIFSGQRHINSSVESWRITELHKLLTNLATTDLSSVDVQTTAIIRAAERKSTAVDKRVSRYSGATQNSAKKAQASGASF